MTFNRKEHWEGVYERNSPLRVSWYQEELDRYSELSNKLTEDASRVESNETGESGPDRNAEYLELLAGFTKPFLQS